ncbi:Rnf-Nqr [Prochlorococcus phage P-SSM7]|uniref:Rnf-Nqr n=1 Tax=Prochlorococcus phage P-SSM7 TaxID=445688 RepID=E3SNV0_9CAUD|nr:Rnf-Nqr [Prochlorococcus phage P-SSM7]ADO98921.1 Rnf-Nqr [Prochlorococcus phage P-SSM7]
MTLIKAWRIWKYALGSFSDEKTRRYDNYVVLVRTFIFISYLVTNCFIISGVIRHWN